MLAVIGPSVHTNRAKETVNVRAGPLVLLAQAPIREGTRSLASFGSTALVLRFDEGNDFAVGCTDTGSVVRNPRRRPGGNILFVFVVVVVFFFIVGFVVVVVVVG